MNHVLFSIITPCFNSSETLFRTYGSLKKQSLRSFEWVLVDDASTDDGKTKSIIQEISDEATFDVQCIFFDANSFGSKTVAAACKVARGEFAAILDHDDQLTPYALERVRAYLERYANRKPIIGVCGRCVDEKGVFIGRPFRRSAIVACDGDIRFRERITSELFHFTRIEVIGEWFSKMKPGYHNGFVWAKLSERYKYVYVNDVLRVYDTALKTSFSNSKHLVVKYPDAKAEMLRENIRSYKAYLSYNPLYTVRILIKFSMYSISAGHSIRVAVSGFSFALKVLIFAVWPVAYCRVRWITPMV